MTQLKLLTLLCLNGLLVLSATAAERPNILFLFCDDLGYGDVGVFHQNQRALKGDPTIPFFTTPHIDAMARSGMKFEQHYCGAPVCAPSRATLLSGQHQGNCSRRNNQFDQEFPDTPTLASVVKQAGYATAAFGKWGLQGPPDKKEERDQVHHPGAKFPGWTTMPMDRGFDYFLGYVRHRDGHYHYPVEDQKQVWENRTEISKGMELCFTTDLFTAAAKKWIIEHHQKAPDQPFFAYLAYDTPHAKLQNPPCAYPEGGGIKGGVQWLGKPGRMINTAHGTYDGWMHPDFAEASWDHDKNPATAQVPWPDVQKRHANNVRRIDDTVGDLVQLLEDLGISDNTLIIFSSDNGPAQESYIAQQPYHPTFFHGFGPFDGIKRDMLEGGLRVPSIAKWPAVIRSKSRAHEASGHWDWLPTFAEAAGLAIPASTDGVSLMPTLRGMDSKQRPSLIYSEYAVGGNTPNYEPFHPAHRGKIRNQMQVLQFGGFKGLRTGIQSADDDFEIYNLRHDPKEIVDLGKDPKFNKLQALMKAEVLRNRLPLESAPRPYDAALVPGYETLEEPKAPAAGRPIMPGAFFVQEKCVTPWIPRLDRASIQTHYKPSKFTLPEKGLLSAPSTGQIAAYIHIPKDGIYTFSVASNSHSMLLIHGIRLLSENPKADGKPRSATLPLTAGWHPVRLHYRCTQGTPEATLHVTHQDGTEIQLSADNMKTLPRSW